MELLLKRFAFKDKYTIGRLYFGDLEFCHTLEPGVACGASKGFIPTGYYRVEINYSPKFKTNLPILLNVPRFEGIRIHAGNTPLDTNGCILVGDNLKVGCVLNSSNRLVELMRLMRKNDIHLIKIE